MIDIYGCGCGLYLCYHLRKSRESRNPDIDELEFCKFVVQGMLETPFISLKFSSHHIQSTFNVSLGIAELEVRDQTLASFKNKQKEQTNIIDTFL